MSEKKHWSLEAREKNIDHLEQLILLNGGWGMIVSNIGTKPFLFYAAKTIGCTTKKCEEYLEIIIQGRIVEQKLKDLRGDQIGV